MRTVLVFAVSLLFAQFCSAGTEKILRVADAVEIAINNHPLIESAKAVIDEARGELLGAISPESPGIAWEYEGIPAGSKLADHEERRLSFSQEIQFPWKTYLLYKQGKTAVRKSVLEGSIIRLHLERHVRESYAEAWEKTQIETILSLNAAAVSENSDNIRKAYELGEASLLDAQRAKVEALSAKRAYDSVVIEKSTAMKNLILLIGADPNHYKLSDPLEKEAVFNNLTDYSAELAASPGLKIEEFNSKIAGYEKRLAYSDWLPDFEVSYFQQHVPAVNDPEFWGMEFSVNIPLWFWAGNRGEMQASKARKNMADAEYNNAVMETALAWNTATANLKIALKNYELSTEEILPLSKQAFDLAMKSYTLGEAAYIDVVDAQRSYLGSRLESAELAASLYRSIIELDAISGKSILDEQYHQLSGAGNEN